MKNWKAIATIRQSLTQSHREYVLAKITREEYLERKAKGENNIQDLLR